MTWCVDLPPIRASAGGVAQHRSRARISRESSAGRVTSPRKGYGARPPVIAFRKASLPGDSVGRVNRDSASPLGWRSRRFATRGSSADAVHVATSVVLRTSLAAGCLGQVVLQHADDQRLLHRRRHRSFFEVDDLQRGSDVRVILGRERFDLPGGAFCTQAFAAGPVEDFPG